jgi:tRNA threonylcarbamoyladenosine biosynthesis protein TsaB
MNTIPAMPPTQSNLVLSIDTAGPACQAVVSDRSRIISGQSVTMLRGHGEALIPMIEQVLADALITYDDLDRIGVTVGPGSFTGMRVGLAAARGFSATLNIPVVGIGTLEAMARSDLLESDVDAVRCVAIDARNGLIYGQRFDANGVAIEPANVMADLVFAASVQNGARLVGPATSIIAALARSAGKRITLGNTADVPSTAALAELSATSDVTEKPKPLYLKPADAITAKPPGLRIGLDTRAV